MPVPQLFCAETDGPDATKALASAIAGCLHDGDLVVLTGDLGAGKTCFTQGMGVGLGIQDRITSPTFTLVATYPGRLRLNHLDVYRLDGAADTLDLDLPDLLEDGVTVIEWGERIDEVLPADRLYVELRYGELSSFDSSEMDDEIATSEANRRYLRFELTGDAWQRRQDPIEAALEPWLCPC